MKDKTKFFSLTEESCKIQNNNESKFSNSNISARFFKSFSKRKIMLGAGVCILGLGFALLFSQSIGYTVYYDEMAVGFVKDPNAVLGNIEEINSTISQGMGCEATVYEKGFSFEKGIHLFKEKNDNKEIADSLAGNCAVDVNVYDIYIDGTYIAQDKSIKGVESAVERIQKEYSALNPDDNYDQIGFVEKLEVTITKGKTVSSANAEELYDILDQSLTVKTVSEIKSEEVIPFAIEYEPTDTKNCGETTVKTAGVDGLIEKVKIVEKHDGKEIASTDVKTNVIADVTNQVVLVGTKGLVISDTGMVTPSRGAITSRMGARWGRNHEGIDIGGDLNDPIYASIEGTVTTAEYKDNGYGNVIVIDHGDGMTTTYAHLNSISVAAGDFVYPGQVIGAMGSTGRSTGVHLHFEVRIDGVAVNPLNYVNY